MRQALARKLTPRARLQPVTFGRDVFLPAPTGGWDTETLVAELPQTRARVFDNWIPKGVQLEMRKGTVDHVTGIAAPVETLMAYNAGASSTLFAAAGSAIYNVTAAGAVGAAVQSGLSNARWSKTNITTSGGSYLWICNGADNPLHYNGSAWATPSLSITTYTDNDILVVFAHKERLFFLFKNTLTFGYLPIQSVAGTIANFPLGAVFSYGGRLIAGGTLSKDAGNGLNDYAVFLTSEGEIAVYAGTNPGSASEWALVGHWYVGEPVGDRPLVDLGDDLGVITRNGLLSVSHIMQGAGSQDGNLDHILTARINTPFRDAAGTGSGFTGWEGLFVSSADLVIVNAPTGTETAQQFVRHRVTGGWGRFTGWNFETFEVFGGELYAGASGGTVYRCLTGHDDDDADITAALETAWTTLGYPGIKTMLEARPIVTTATRAALRMVARTDYRDAPPLPPFPFATITNALIWGSGIWGTALWGGEDATTRQWRAISGEGHAVSLALEAKSSQSTFGLNGVNLRYDIGGGV